MIESTGILQFRGEDIFVMGLDGTPAWGEIDCAEALPSAQWALLEDGQ